MVDLNALPRVSVSQRRKLPETAGVYFVLTNDLQLLYIGSTIKLRRRWATAHHKEHKFEQAAFIAWLSTDDYVTLELSLIAQFNPPLNGFDKSNQFHCHKCHADWTPRKEGELPIQCPRCKSVSWNKPREPKETK